MSATIVLTAYCACATCCGPTAPRATAAGTMPVPGITIAAPRRVPLGTWVEITLPGRRPVRRRVDDRTTKAIDGWDLYLPSHDAAAKFGKTHATVRILKAP